jgi:hypothetical protein
MLTFRSSPHRMALLLTITLFRTTGHAEPVASEAVRVETRGELACGTAERFLQTVFARTPRAREARDAEPGRTFHVAIRRNADGLFHGELVVSETARPSGESGRRVISGEACSEVFDALALFAALSVDPEASTAELPDEAVKPAAAPVAPSEPSHAPPAPSAPLPVRSSTPAGPDARGPRSASTAWRLRGGAHVGAMSAGLSSELLLVMPFVEGGFGRDAKRAVAFSPAARLWFSAPGGSTRATVQGPASLHWTTARLDACPLEINLLPTLASRPCLTLAGGTLRASGVTIAYPTRRRLPWASLGVVTRLEWRFLGFIALEGALGVDLPPWRNAFHFDPATPIYRVPVALWHASAGLGVDFL